MKSKFSLDFACVDCGKKPEPTKRIGELELLPTKCPDCGGKIRPKVN